MKLIKKIILLRGVGTIYNILLTDCEEFLEIKDWKFNAFSNFEENTNFVKSIKQNNQYFIEMNSNSFTLIKTDIWTLDLSNNVINTPTKISISEILTMTSKFILKI